jgi:hypothetical protein
MVPFICNPMLSFMNVGCRHVVELQSCFQVLTFFAPLNYLQFLILIQFSFLEDKVWIEWLGEAITIILVC